MTQAVFWQGMVMGFVLCAPLGPVGIICVRHTIVAGRWAGAMAVLGASVVDALYAGTAALGVTALTAWLEPGLSWIRPVAGLVLIVAGLRLAHARPSSGPSGREEPNGARDAFVSTLLLMLSNPLPIVALTAVWSGVHVDPAVPLSALAPCLAAGVFMGSAAWAPILAFGVHGLARWIGGKAVAGVLRACAVGLCLCGAGLIATPLLTGGGG
jgi:threonine/homoserine/homoserine lactone efflux protein